LETCRQSCQGITDIFHEAVLGSVQGSVDDPISSHHANATGTLHILMAAKEAKVRRVIYASSPSVYGNISADPEEGPAKAEDLRPAPHSPMRQQNCSEKYIADYLPTFTDWRRSP
jgi:nucleoside-diphosphate-sugar epimerase